MTALSPPSGPAWRAAEVRKADMLRLGFRDPVTRVVVNGKPRGFPEETVIVVAKAPCGRFVSAALTGSIQPCGPRCTCVEGKA